MITNNEPEEEGRGEKICQNRNILNYISVIRTTQTYTS